jgi:diguanylate cyclase (GGDEF)-like protein/PAS domain S-box-containing protein
MAIHLRIHSDIQAMRGIIDAVPHPVFVKDEESRFVLVNQAMCDIMGHTFEELIGRTDRDFVPAEEAEIYMARDRIVLETGEPNENEEPLSAGGGEIRTIVTGKRRLVLADGSRLIVGCINDITAFRRAEFMTRHLAEHDGLTGLANRALLRTRLDETIDAVRRGEGNAAFLLVDLDGFKNINDALGHAAGDDLLIQIAKILTDLAGPQAIVGRLGGDEFAIVQRAGTQPDGAIALAVQIIGRLSQPMSLNRRQAFVSASIGIAPLDPECSDREAVKRQADHALYAAKRAGRNTWRLFEAEMEAAHMMTRIMEDDLRLALTKREFSVAYQPFVGVSDRAVHGFEALLRWTHPTRGVMDPATFIPIAERTGVIATLGEWILRRACQEAARWPADLRIAVNVSAVQLARGDMPEIVAGVLRETGLDPRRLELEITETAIIRDLDGARRTFNALRLLGARVVLDDFGAGYSSLQILKSLPFDKIKIDRGLLTDVGHLPQADAIVGAILQLTRTLGLPVVAEGIETEDQLRLISEEMCEEAQGFLFGRPAPVATYGMAGFDMAARKSA